MTFLGIVNLKGKTAAEIMNVVQKFFTAKSLRIHTILFSVLDGTNSMSGKKNGLQTRIRYHSPFSIYINCRNHGLALCLTHLMREICRGEIMNDYDTFTWTMENLPFLSKAEFTFRIISCCLWEET